MTDGLLFGHCFKTAKDLSAGAARPDQDSTALHEGGGARLGHGQQHIVRRERLGNV